MCAPSRTSHDQMLADGRDKKAEKTGYFLDGSAGKQSSEKARKTARSRSRGDSPGALAIDVGAGLTKRFAVTERAFEPFHPMRGVKRDER